MLFKLGKYFISFNQLESPLVTLYRDIKNLRQIFFEDSKNKNNFLQKYMDLYILAVYLIMSLLAEEGVRH